MQQMRMVLVVLKFGLIEVNSHCLTQAFHVWNRSSFPRMTLLSSHCEQPYDSNVYLDSLDAFRALAQLDRALFFEIKGCKFESCRVL